MLDYIEEKITRVHSSLRVIKDYQRSSTAPDKQVSKIDSNNKREKQSTANIWLVISSLSVSLNGIHCQHSYVPDELAVEHALFGRSGEITSFPQLPPRSSRVHFGVDYRFKEQCLRDGRAT